MSNDSVRQEEERLTWKDAVGLFIIVAVIVVLLIGGGVLGNDIGRDVVRVSICIQSGFDGYEEIRNVDYCYIGEGVDIVFVPLLVTMPEEATDGR